MRRSTHKDIFIFLQQVIPGANNSQLNRRVCLMASLIKAVNPHPTASCPIFLVCNESVFLTAELRRVIFLCVTLRRTLRNAAVKRTQTHLQPSKVFWIHQWFQARPAN
jgi:hypothetical protein